MRSSKALAPGAVLLVLLAGSIARAQSGYEEHNPQVADWAGGYFASFYLLEDAPQGFEEFESISVEYLPGQDRDEKLLIPDERGQIPTLGELRTKDETVYKFKRSKLVEGGRLIKLSFLTERVEGVSYSFEGEYLRVNPEIRKGDLIIGYIHLEGTLTKYKDGRKVAQAKLGLNQRGIE